MENIEKNELLMTIGGSISGPIISGINSIIKTIYSFGQNFGGALRRFITRKNCRCL